MVPWARAARLVVAASLLCEPWNMTSDSIHAAGENFTTDQYPLLIFYDGDCSFCNRWVARVRAADAVHRIRYGTQQGRTFARLASLHPELGRRDTVVVVKRRSDGSEEFLVRSLAIRTVIDGLPGFGFFDRLLHVVPLPISDLGYMFISKARGLLFGPWHGCRVPIEQDPERFVD